MGKNNKKKATAGYHPKLTHNKKDGAPHKRQKMSDGVKVVEKEISKVLGRVEVSCIDC